MDSAKKQSICLGIILLIIGIVSFVYWGNKKEVWFCDEIYTYESANGFEQAWPNTNVGQWMTGADVEAFFAADSDRISLNDITTRLYSDHVPLYFWIFRIVSFFFFKGSGSIWIGLSINLFFYLVILGTVYMVFSRLSGSPCVGFIVGVLSCVTNRLMLEQATMLRMYMMLLCAEILLLLVAARILADLEKDKISAGAFLLLYAVSVIGFLTHYDFWIFYAVTVVVFCLWILIKSIYRYRKLAWTSREFRCLYGWVGNFAVSLLTTLIIFPYARWNLNRGKGQAALRSILDFSGEKVENILWGYQRLAASMLGEKIPAILGLLIIFGCIIGGAIALYKNKDTFKMTMLLLTVIASQGYQLAVCFTMPDAKEERYIWGTNTIIMLCMAWGGILILQVLFSKMKQRKSGKVVRSITATVLSIGILVLEITIINGGSGIAYLFNELRDVSLLEENSSIPWVVYGPTVGVYSYYDWIIPEKICFLTLDNSKEDAMAVRELQDEDSFVLYIYEDYCPEALAFFERELGRELQCEQLTRSTNLSVYLIRL